MPTNEYGTCKVHNVQFLKQYGCAQCNNVCVVVKICTYGFGASGENAEARKVEEGKAETEEA